ncbi:MAG TPA: alpha-L-arabinofuranosidase C-terminal domain-containing protein, partial [Candidatus Sumerlaeota bacterium]|nr:alpha-L-arabinofuranosidase C-terminal domain-containing protein [Candidatus Sumerlaeota bacterium]
AYLKAVNPTDKPIVVALKVEGAAPAKATMQIVAPGSLQARNTLEKPDAVKAAEGKVTLEGGVARFEMPAYSAAVVTLSGK